jgi:hypothetical protein
MAEFSEDMFNDENHWTVTLRGTIGGEADMRSYHLPADSKGHARADCLRKFSGDWDDVPFICNVERYRSWRNWEAHPEGQCGMS